MKRTSSSTSAALAALALSTTALFALGPAGQDGAAQQPAPAAPAQGDPSAKQHVWTLDDAGRPTERVTLHEVGSNQWQPVSWTTFHPSGRKSGEGVKQEGQRVPGTWTYWNEQGEVTDLAKTIDAMNTAIAELMARPEKEVQDVTVQHVLIAYVGAPRIQGVTRSRDEAEILAAQVFEKLKGGADMDTMVREHTDDSPPGIYKMTMGTPTSADVRPRQGMVPAFGDVGWRLEVGEIGVAPMDPQKSPFGWHIIKRTE